MPINHDVFGEISYDLYWRGEQKIKFFGQEKTIVLSIDGNEEGEFHEIQKDAYKKFFHNMNDIMKKVEDALFDYYQKVFMDYRAIFDKKEVDRLVPIINDKRELAKLVSPTQLIIRRVRKNGLRRVGMLFDCTWEAEHGVGVKVEDEEIIEVGFQDIVL
ncbi:DUF6985 domain-containing protein [Lysinibacillus sp. 3P01SB]|uniref:DUF6985 domain-containing protein n=1 Tax=Lysinibacillus sp. 3P01SB TaxID=3132284 RepID=UPI0039A44A33